MVPIHEPDANETVLVEYIANQILPIVSEGGVWMAPSCAPLSARRIERALKKIMRSPNYSRQTLLTADETGAWWRGQNGEVTADTTLPPNEDRSLLP